MIKSKLLSLASAVTLSAALLSGCGQNDSPNPQDKDIVRFSVNLPDNTRSYGDGTKATYLQCLVYTKATDTNAGGFVYAVSDDKIKRDATGNFSVEVQLPENFDYNLVFVASAPTSADWTSPYTINQDDGLLTVSYAAMTPNDDRADIFYAHYEYTPGLTKGSNVTLTRPMAQLNVGTTDRSDATVSTNFSSGIYTSVSFKAYTTLDLRNGAVGGEMTEPFTTRIAPIADTPLTDTAISPAPILTNVVYILAPAEMKYPTDLTFAAYDAADAATPRITTSVPAIPLQRNYRTNIYGALLTQGAAIDVQISSN